MMDARSGTGSTGASSPFWAGQRPVPDVSANIVATLAHLRRNLPFLTLWILLFVGCGAVYAKLLRPDYIATTQVLLQPRVVVNDGPENLRRYQQLMIDGVQCETELHVLRSEQLLFRVFQALKLAEAPEIREGVDGVWAYLSGKVDQFERLVTPAQDSTQAFNVFKGRVRSRRLGLSYVIEISYRAYSAQQAARVVNSIGAAYAVYRLRGVISRELRRGVYRESRLAGLQTEIMAAEAGMRFGTIPDNALADADVRLLGPASLPLGSVFPKATPILFMMAGLGAVTGLLIVLLSRRKTVPVARRRAYRSHSSNDARIA
ncbi:Wzz/FepE/Etk N-terminal domain-containing protein [Methylobacterium sp. J-076]|uniref:Wzz/FepE/Etk N-terminal domain-containing protein n=1 Tax=Methylobacterium sp. J-076 TaxID=2836655 RepID=UPI001FBAE622|nr:Wzz/FepE/Etk N-terminal domain-containing protein [Methylobacterium sp. J-076]MCJ2012620.1 Wzz/FepE/Etk N-terminal domain-containing protein [Methylobacterium sp. J-076]